MLNRFVVVDLETTGNSPKKGDKIIQVAAVVVEDGQITETFSSFVNPCQPIPAFIEELTGINDEMVKNAPLFSEIAPKVMSLLGDTYFVAHNVLFDLSFLQNELTQSGYNGFYGPLLDTVEMARILYPTADGYKLSDLAVQENLMHDRPHQADSDALVTAELLLLLLNKISQLPRKTLSQLAELSGGLKSDLQQLLSEILLQKEKTVEELNAEIEIFQGIALKKIQSRDMGTVKEAVARFPFLDQEKIEILEKAFKPFEKRQGQFVMMDGVYNAFSNQSHLIIEAGTGVGKSIGYLLPAAYFSHQTETQVIISTHTIQLQEQLIQKEIPVLQRIVPFPITAVLLKGKEHYINLERFSQTLYDDNDNYDTILTKMQILIWLLETGTGDKDELNLSSGGQIYWNKIKLDNTSRQTKTWMERDFYLRAKKKAERANLIITNHSLLLSDLSTQNSILPQYSYAIIDEGHHLEKAAANYFGRKLDYLGLRLFFSQIGLYEQKQLFFQLEMQVERLQDDRDELIHSFELNRLMGELFYEVDEFFRLTSLYAQKSPANKKQPQRLRVRFNPRSKESSAMIFCAERLVFLLKDVHDHFQKRIGLMERYIRSLSEEQKKVLIQMGSILAEIKEIWETFQEAILTESDNVKWVEMDLRAPQNVTTITMMPPSAAHFLKKDLFGSKKSVVITSATLTVNQSYHYVLKELGLADGSIHELSIPSPFNYKKQVQLLIPTDLPEVNMVELDEYVIAITEHIISIAEATKGRMLLLFTSHEMLKKTYELIKESGFLNDFAIIAQGITSGSQTRLTRNFQRYEKAILLGTSSFWEGVDIPGEDLSCLVIVRLPFSSPDDPYTEAKCELIKKQGGNPFMEFSLPEAILRFKQGFGRLIRTEKDRGIIVVFDKRIVSTKYGYAFFKSIPDVPVKKGGIDELIRVIQEWLC